MPELTHLLITFLRREISNYMELSKNEKQEIRQDLAADAEAILNKMETLKSKLSEKDWHFDQYLDFIKQDLDKFLSNLKWNDWKEST